MTTGRTVVRMVWRAALGVVLAVSLTGIASLEALFAPSADLWPVWQAHDETSTAKIDHSAWDRLLHRYVAPGLDGVARFDYRRVSGADRIALETYIRMLAGVAVSRLRRAEQFAYWVNLYNALTVKLILDHGIPASIRDIDISPGLFAVGPWDAKLIRIEGHDVTLNDIEHRILRPIFHDPRIHYALNCAAIGCPDLQRTAFTAANSDALLEAAARAYVNHPRGARFENGGLRVSSIYVWYAEDFGGEQGVLAHLRKYARGKLAKRLASTHEIADYGYDWSLNGAGP